MSDEDQKRIENKIKLMEYHHQRMDSRRSIGFKAFLSLVTLFIVAIKGASDLINHVSQCVLKVIALKVNVIIGFVSLCFVFGLFIWQIEKRSKADREKYISLEREVYSLLHGQTKYDKYEEKNWCKSIRESWAGTWPVIAAIILTFVSSMIVGVL